MVTTERHDDYYGILLGEFGKDGISDGGTLYRQQAYCWSVRNNLYHM